MEGFLAGCFGAAFQELLHWYNLRRRLDEKKYNKLLRSAGYWVIVVLFICGGAAGSVLWYADFSSHVPIFHYVVVSAAFPTIFKRMVGVAVKADESTTFGVASEIKSYLKGG